MEPQYRFPLQRVIPADCNGPSSKSADKQKGQFIYYYYSYHYVESAEVVNRKEGEMFPVSFFIPAEVRERWLLTWAAVAPSAQFKVNIRYARNSKKKYVKGRKKPFRKILCSVRRK